MHLLVSLWVHSLHTFLFVFIFCNLKKSKNCIKEQILTGSNKKLPSPTCNTRLTKAKKLEGKKKTGGGRRLHPQLSPCWKYWQQKVRGYWNLSSMRSSTLSLCWGDEGSPIFLTSFSLQRTISAKHVKRLYVRVSYIVFLCCNGWNRVALQEDLFFLSKSYSTRDSVWKIIL